MKFTINDIDVGVEVLDRKLGRELKKTFLPQLGQHARRVWIDTARLNFSPRTAEEYIAGIGLPQVESDGTIKIRLSSALPNMLEDNAKSFDIVPGLLKRNTLISKDGIIYRDIPADRFDFLPRKQKFIRVTEESTWIHPGFKNRGILPKVREQVLKDAKEMLLDILAARFRV